jgi:two-component system sensor kinase
MRERLAAVGGELTISSPPGGPTQLAATIPLLLERGEPAVVIR